MIAIDRERQQDICDEVSAKLQTHTLVTAMTDGPVNIELYGHLEAPLNFHPHGDHFVVNKHLGTTPPAPDERHRWVGYFEVSLNLVHVACWTTVPLGTTPRLRLNLVNGQTVYLDFEPKPEPAA